MVLDVFEEVLEAEEAEGGEGHDKQGAEELLIETGKLGHDLDNELAFEGLQVALFRFEEEDEEEHRERFEADDEEGYPIEKLPLNLA